MSGPEWALTAAVSVLAIVVAAGLFVAARLLRRLSAAPAPKATARVSVASNDKAHQGKRSQRHTRTEHAPTVVDDTRAAAAAARADAAAAKAEATAARGEARRILDNARSEADGLLERAHKQADHAAEQARAHARRAGEREVATLTAVAKEQAADAERRQQRLDERERLAADEAERLAERDRRIASAEADLAERESALVIRETEITASEEIQRRELERVAGSQLDPNCVAIFVRLRKNGTVSLKRNAERTPVEVA